MNQKLFTAVVVAGCLAFLFTFHFYFFSEQGHLLVQPNDIVIPRHCLKDGHIFYFELKNVGKKVVDVISVQKNCNCVAMADLPITIPPNSSAQYPITLDFEKIDDSVKELYFVFKTIPLSRRCVVRLAIE